MGRGRHCTPELRAQIIKLNGEKKSKSDIARIVGCSRKLVYNAIHYFNQYNTIQNKIRRSRPLKTSSRTNRKIFRMSDSNPFLSSSEIRDQINMGLVDKISSRTVRRRLFNAGLHGCISRKKPVVTEENIKKRLDFANSHLNKTMAFWKTVLWSDETKINLIGNDGETHVRRPINKPFDPRYTTKTIKHGGGNLMIWAAMSFHGVGPICKIKGRMKAEQYRNILAERMEPYAEENLPVTWRFMHDNDPKHTAGIVKTWLEENSVDVLSWPPQSPDLNPIEHLWNDLKKQVKIKKPKNKEELWRAIRKAWRNIPKERCENLVKSMNRRCVEVIKNKGYPTKY